MPHQIELGDFEKSRRMATSTSTKRDKTPFSVYYKDGDMKKRMMNGSLLLVDWSEKLLECWIVAEQIYM